jgi:hypothetical protein
MSASDIRSALDCGRGGCACRTGQNTHCPGPSHRNGDRNPSLTVHDRDGKTLVNCKGGCDQGDVIAILQERGAWPRPEERERAGAGVRADQDRRDLRLPQPGRDAQLPGHQERGLDRR